MAVDKIVRGLDSADIGRADAITEDWLSRAMSSLSGLYEGLIDDSAPGTATQLFSGHDHVQSGGPITRGCSWSGDGGATGMFTYTPVAANQKELIDFDETSKAAGTARYYGSPLFSSDVANLGGRICYSAVGSKFKLEFRETAGTALAAKPKTVEMLLQPQTDSGDTPILQWVNLPDIPMSPGIWNHMEVYAENDTHDGITNPELIIYGIYLSEIPGVTKYRRPSSLLSRLSSNTSNAASTADMAFAAFEVLDQSLSVDTYWMDTDVLSRLYWFCNALYELALDTNAPNKADQTVKGHDHDDYGGVNVTRNKVCAINMGSQLPFLVQVAASGEHGTTTPSTSDPTWHLFDRDTATSGLRSTAGIPHMIGPVSPGVVNTGTATPPFLDARVFVLVAGSVTGYDVRVAIYNRNQAAFSAVGTLSTGGSTGVKGWIEIDEIPCVADVFNDFDIYVQTTVASVTTNMSYCQVSETAIIDGTLVSQPSSAGATTHLGVAHAF